MEGKDNNKKIPYEELSKIAGNLHRENEYLKGRNQQLEAALVDSDMNKLSFIMSTLFKVVENREAYSSEFVVFCIEKIENAVKSFYVEPESPEPSTAS